MKASSSRAAKQAAKKAAKTAAGKNNKKKSGEQTDDEHDDLTLDEKGKMKSKKKNLSSKDVMARLNKVTGKTLDSLKKESKE